MTSISMDFITNSSSSSYTMIGIYVDSGLLTKNHLIKIQNALPNEKITMNDLEDYLYDYIEILIKGTDLDYNQDPDSGLILGISYTDMKDEETLREFKDRIKQSLKSIFGVDIELAVIRNTTTETAFRNKLVL